MMGPAAIGPGNKQLKILVDARLASAFKAACRDSGVSMAKELSGYMAKYVGMAEKTQPQGAVRTATRRDRRTLMRSIVPILAAIRDAEEAYLGNIPENLGGGPAYEDAERAVSTMDEAISLLDEVYG